MKDEAAQLTEYFTKWINKKGQFITVYFTFVGSPVTEINNAFPNEMDSISARSKDSLFQGFSHQ